MYSCTSSSRVPQPTCYNYWNCPVLRIFIHGSWGTRLGLITLLQSLITSPILALACPRGDRTESAGFYKASDFLTLSIVWGQFWGYNSFTMILSRGFNLFWLRSPFWVVSYPPSTTIIAIILIKDMMMSQKPIKDSGVLIKRSCIDQSFCVASVIGTPQDICLNHHHQ